MIRAAVDAVEEVEADVRLPGDGERLVQQQARRRGLSAVQRDLGLPLQRQRLPGRGPDGPVEPRRLAQVRVGVVQGAGKQLGLAAQRGRERQPATGAEPLRLGAEGLGERDHVRVGPRPVEQPLGHAEVAVEHADRELAQRVRVEQVGPEALPQVVAGVRGGGLRPGRDHQRGPVAGLPSASLRHSAAVAVPGSGVAKPITAAPL